MIGVKVKAASIVLKELLEEAACYVENGKSKPKIKIGLTIDGSELGKEEVCLGAGIAQTDNPDLKVILIGSYIESNLKRIDAQDEKEAHDIMDAMLASGEIDAAVTLHYNFPMGVTTVGRVITPARGKELFISSTTGLSDSDRTAAMIKNAIYGIVTAKACGYKNPSVGILNVEGARQVERALEKMKDSGYSIVFAESGRSDAGKIMRGNDLITASSDVIVTDSLTGNILMKLFSAYSTGGQYEAFGYGYGPGIGDNFNKIIMIISRASGASVIAGAIKYASEVVKGNIFEILTKELSEAKKCGFEEILKALVDKPSGILEKEMVAPKKKITTEEISGIDVLQIDEAVIVLWTNQIYAEGGMGCTGPIIKVAEEDKEKAIEILNIKKYI